MKTSELTGHALNWAVAEAEYKTAPPSKGWVLEHHKTGQQTWPYATAWEWGGPIMERERIGVYWSSGQWIAEWWPDNSGMARNPAQKFQHNRYTCGPTPLVAAMRAYVASKFGDEVDVPAELED